MVGWSDIPHISNQNFQPVIDRALALPGFPEDKNGAEVTVGFARSAVLGVADKVIEAVKSGAVRHFFLVAGCDGAKPGRNYCTEFVEKTPEDTIVLTLACGKFRFYDKQLGDIGGIPRLLDIGQCNDAYSAVQIATALSKPSMWGSTSFPCRSLFPGTSRRRYVCFSPCSTWVSRGSDWGRLFRPSLRQTSLMCS